MIKKNNILIKNIYYMLSYAFQELNTPTFESVKKEDFDNIHNLFAAILSIGIGQQLKQGLYKEYISRKDDLSVVRGKINISDTIKNFSAQNNKLNCEFDELSENNTLNQILKTTSMILLHHSEVEKKHKIALKKVLLFFSNIDTINLCLIKWSSIKFQSNNRTYLMLINLCRLLTEKSLLTTEKGKYKLHSFIESPNMPKLYEKFIFEYFRKNFPLLKVKASQIAWDLDDNYSAMLPVMQSDITLSYEERFLIIDAKFYSHSTLLHYEKHTLHSNNLYQIFTYVKNKNVEADNNPQNVSGMLLYAKTDDDIQPDGVYYMSGNKISVKTLDLNLSFKHIAEQMDSIARSHFGEKIFQSPY